MERAMGIEPTGKAVLGLENKRFGAIAETKCDWRVNFRGTWGYVGIREPLAVPPDVPVGIAGRPVHFHIN
jgi:hypothetical protein